METRVTVENINGKRYTVVWYVPPQKTKPEQWFMLDDRSYVYTEFGIHLATALPALPRKPKPEDAPLLYRYMAEGVMCRGKCFDLFGDVQENVLIFPQMESEITHATDKDGNKVEVAIDD